MPPFAKQIILIAVIMLLAYIAFIVSIQIAKG